MKPSPMASRRGRTGSPCVNASKSMSRPGVFGAARQMTRTYLKIADRGSSVDPINARNDSAPRTSSGNASGIIFRRKHIARWTSWSKPIADQAASSLKRCCGFSIPARSGNAAAKLSELQKLCTGAFRLGVAMRILRRIDGCCQRLRDRGVLDEEECFIVRDVRYAKGGGAEIGPTKRGKGMKIMSDC